jgi:Heliorhodopsin
MRQDSIHTTDSNFVSQDGLTLTSEGQHNLKANQRVVEQRSKHLRKLNWAACIFQLLAAIALYLPMVNDYGKTYPWYTLFPDVNDGGLYTDPVPRKFADLPVAVLSAVFLTLSAIDHFLVAGPLRGMYERLLACNRSPIRWTEYAFSAAIMRVQIAVLSGVLDIHLLWCLFGLTACTMVFGLLFEQLNSDRRLNGMKIRWLSFVLGFVPHLFGWLVILCYFFRSLKVGDPPGRAP